ncbi:MAG: methylated-DNA--[protein]-cysteine S-methyltransferase [Acidobacteriota bacterium]|jgi:methylated-DNA-[protein]-cysteine S-methyltransferase|nr:methylated-DNA--[protein]-cysteine S-methyltransferase [Acidobacteriota bacterium]NLT33832.1 methylated-DNA--[protein]-cysteine S-methyltransferase [Acidobacteriota bacterium]
MMLTTTIPSPLGPILLSADERGLTSIRIRATAAAGGNRPPDCLREPARQLAAYFKGELKTFRLDLHPEGTEFQLAVWRELEKIPYGTTLSYGEVAARIGRPAAARAVGGANGRNPLPIVVPCHRVIAGDGSLGGYTGGIDIKRFLLALEAEHSPSAKAWPDASRMQE